MKPSEVKRFAAFYQRHLKLLKLQGKSKSTIDTYSPPVRRVRSFIILFLPAPQLLKTCEAFIHFTINHNLSIAGIIDEIDELQIEKNGTHEDSLFITSIHRAKGLEWPLVVLPGLEDEFAIL